MLSLVLALQALAAPEMIPIEVFEAAQKPRIEAIETTIEIPLRGGGTFRLSDHRGRPVVMTFWASWCGPCRQELPDLALWAGQHSEVDVLAVSIDRSQAAAEQFIRSVSFDLPVAFDPDAAHLGQYGVESMPTMFLFDARGELAWRHVGYSRESGFTELDKALAALR